MNPDTTVYVTAHGTCWHLSTKCAGNPSNIHAMSLREAVSGVNPCRNCVSEANRNEAFEVLGV